MNEPLPGDWLKVFEYRASITSNHRGHLNWISLHHWQEQPTIHLTNSCDFVLTYHDCLYSVWETLWNNRFCENQEIFLAAAIDGPWILVWELLLLLKLFVQTCSELKNKLKISLSYHFFLSSSRTWVWFRLSHFGRSR